MTQGKRFNINEKKTRLATFVFALAGGMVLLVGGCAQSDVPLGDLEW